MRRLRLDPFVALLLGAVALASLLPCRGMTASVLDVVTKLAIGLLFFLHGARLSREVLVAGLVHWRLHIVVLATTFVLFPALGLLGFAPATHLLGRPMAMGLLYLCLVPSTVQSSIALTSIAGGNVPAAVCTASLSNLLGILVTPLLSALLLGLHGSGSNEGGALLSIGTQLLLPFVLGHLCRPLLVDWLVKRQALLPIVDRGSILMVVYTAFSAAVVQGLWGHIGGVGLALAAVADVVLLGIVLVVTWQGSAALGFARPDRITILFCGSKKSLASGVPMAAALFPPAMVGAAIVPLMIFHQIQLIAGALIARRLATNAEPWKEAVARKPA